VTSTTPRYKAIEDFLLERIHGGAYPVNHQIPPEEQLARDFDVSRMTANKAINNLVLNIAAEVRGRGHAYSNDVLRCEAVEADDEVALRLGLRLGAQVFHSILVHREDGVPIQLEDRYVNPRWVPHYLECDFSQQTPNEVLVASCPIADVEHVVEAVLVDVQTAAWLDIDPASPCLSMIRRTWSAEHLISYARLIHPGARYKLRSRMKRR
jgi:GntR family histidine utilization transcriptional repressor